MESRKREHNMVASSVDMASVFRSLTAEEKPDLVAATLELLRPDNIALKSEVHNPQSLSVMTILAQRLSHSAPRTSKLLHAYVEHYLRYMVSYKRKSRAEFVAALQQVAEETEKESKLEQLVK